MSDELRTLHVAARLATPAPTPLAPYRPHRSEPRRRAVALLAAWTRAGACPALLTTGTPDRQGGLPLGARVRLLGSDALPTLATVAAARRLARSADSLHLHLDGRTRALTPLGVALAGELPVVVHLSGLHGAAHRTGAVSTTAGRLVDGTLEGLLLARARLVVTPNEELAAVATRLGARWVQVVTPALLEVADPTPAPRPLPHLRGPRVVAVGALSRRARAGGLLAVLARHDRAQLVLVGAGSTRREVERRAVALGVASRVHVVARPSWRAVVAHLAAADVVASTALSGEDPATALLARAHGAPLVATDVEGIRGLVGDGTDGVLVPAADDPALTDAVVGLLEDPDRRRALGDAGRRRVAARTWDDVGAAARRLLDTTAGRSRERAVAHS